METLETPSAQLAEELSQTVLDEALRGLRSFPKTLSPWLFYDERGSQLFERITELPEYYLTRLERAIFAERADEIVQFAGSPVAFLELGAGSASKTGVILKAAARRQREVRYQPIDVSRSALEEARASLTETIPGLSVVPLTANYITDAYQVQRPQGHSLFGLYIGSSIANFTPEEAVGILHKLRSHLSKPGDALLLGVDLAPSNCKSVKQLLAAYDDAAGVTAAFNLNVLTRLNREAGANFDVRCFRHRAHWNAEASRIEMHLESLVPQSVHLGGERFAFAAGETIHTESSYKYTERGVKELLEKAGFGSPRWLYDGECWFAVALAHSA